MVLGRRHIFPASRSHAWRGSISDYKASMVASVPAHIKIPMSPTRLMLPATSLGSLAEYIRQPFAQSLPPVNSK